MGLALLLTTTTMTTTNSVLGHRAAIFDALVSLVPAHRTSHLLLVASRSLSTTSVQPKAEDL
jgi:CHASE2 domain-containing sensor protein